MLNVDLGGLGCGLLHIHAENVKSRYMSRDCSQD